MMLSAVPYFANDHFQSGKLDLPRSRKILCFFASNAVYQETLRRGVARKLCNSRSNILFTKTMHTPHFINFGFQYISIDITIYHSYRANFLT